MKSPAAHISFPNGVCRRLSAKDVPSQVEEAILACDATQLEANLLDERLAVVAHVRRDWSAMNGFVVVKAAGSADPRIDGYNVEYLGAKPARAGEDY